MTAGSMTRSLAVCLVAAALFSPAVSAASSAEPTLDTVLVATDGTGDTSSLGEALELVSTGGRIRLAAGEYQGGVMVSRDVTITGVPGGGSVILAPAGSSGLYIRADDVVLRQVSLRSHDLDARSPSAIDISGGSAMVDHCAISDVQVGVLAHSGARGEIRDCRIAHASDAAIFIQGNGTNVAISRNRIDGTKADVPRLRDDGSIEAWESHLGSEYGVHVGYGASSTIENNVIKGYEETLGIWVEGRGASAVIAGNHVSGNGWGIEVTDGADATIESNKVADMENTGIWIGGAGGDVSIRANELTRNQWGVYVSEGADPVIEANTVTDQTATGIDIEGRGTRAEVRGNHVSGNGWGIEVTDGADARIESNKVADQENTGILVSGEGGDVSIRANELTGNQWGVYVSEGADPLVEANTVKGQSKTGIGAEGIGSEPIVRANHISGGDWGVWVEDGAAPTTEANSIVDAATGVGIEGAAGTLRGNRISGGKWAIDLKGGSRPLVVDNDIVDPENTGIAISGEGTDADVTGNDISGAEWAIWVGDGGDARVAGNRIVDSDTGIDVDGTDPAVQGNVITGGTRGVYAHGNTTATIEGNTIAGAASAGFEIAGDGADPYVSGNTVTRNSDGVTVTQGSAASIEGNEITDSREAGIRVADAGSAPAIEGNTLAGNWIDLDVDPSASPTLGLNDMAPPPEPCPEPGITLGPTGSLPTVTVLDPGVEPRRLLRYELSDGQTEGFRLDFDIDMRMTMEGTTTPWFDSPTIAMSGTSTVVSVADDETYEIETVITEVAVADDGDPALAEQLRAQVQSTVGMTVQTRMDDRGRVLESESTMPAGYVAPQGVPQPGQYDAMAANQAQPLPEEPVGEGATWEVTTTDPSMGLETVTVTTVTLDELAADGAFTASGRMCTSAEPQAMTLPEMPDAVETTLDVFAMEGRYRWDIDPARLIVVSEVDSRSAYAFTISALGETQSTEMEMRLGVGLQPAETKPAEAKPAPALEPPPWFRGRVEMPEEGFAVTLPEGWAAMDPAADTEAQWQAVRATWDGDSYRSEDNTELAGSLFLMAGPGVRPIIQECNFAPAPAGQTAAFVESVVDDLASLDGDVIDTRTIDLPAGSATVVDADAYDFLRFAVYLIEAQGRAMSLTCMAVRDRPEDDWLSIAEAFEFLPVEDVPPDASVVLPGSASTQDELFDFIDTLRGVPTASQDAATTVMVTGTAGANRFTEPDRYGTIELEEQGQGPLHTLRYDPTVGDSRSVRFTISRSEATAVDGQRVAQFATGTFIVDADVTVTSAFDDGTFEVVTEIVAVEPTGDSSRDAEARVLAGSLETLVGLTIRERYDDRGNRSFVEVSDPIEEGTELHPARGAVPSIIEHMVLRLPAEPVGLGGSWVVVTHASQEGGLEIVNTSRNTVTAVEPDGSFLIETTETGDQTVVPQTVDPSALEPGVVVIVDTIEGKADSVSRLDPTWPLPAYEGAWSAAFRMGLDAEDQSFEYASSMATELTIAPEGLMRPSAEP